MFGPHKYVVAGVAVALAAVLILVKKNGVAGVAAGVGEAAVEAASGLVGGVAIGVGDAIGLPRTNETECQKALREGRTWDASRLCPAGTYIGSDQNFVYQGVNWIGGVLTGEEGWDLGGKLYDWTN
jgi:hypothetical protein